MSSIIQNWIYLVAKILLSIKFTIKILNPGNNDFHHANFSENTEERFMLDNMVELGSKTELPTRYQKRIKKI